MVKVVTSNWKYEMCKPYVILYPNRRGNSVITNIVIPQTNSVYRSLRFDVERVNNAEREEEKTCASVRRVVYTHMYASSLCAFPSFLSWVPTTALASV